MHESSSITSARTHHLGEEEAARASRIDELGLANVDSPSLDLVVRRAARLMGAPMAAVSVILRDDQIQVARVGLEERVTSRVTSICTHVTARRAPVVLQDATRDPEFALHPSVGCDGEAIRSYCGVPILDADGSVLAVLCVADTEPHAFPSDEVDTLWALSDAARAILVPLLDEPPAHTFLEQERELNAPQECRLDPLYRWIERTVPDVEELTLSGARGGRGRWLHWLVGGSAV